MMIELVRTHWALAVASVIVVALVLRSLWNLAGRSPRGKLRRANKRLKAARSVAIQAKKRAARARRHAERLEQKAQSVPPIRLEEARGALTDAESLSKIAGDQLMVAENQLRKVVVEQFPPDQHDRLRDRYLKDDGRKTFPFKFS